MEHCGQYDIPRSFFFYQITYFYPLFAIYVHGIPQSINTVCVAYEYGYDLYNFRKAKLNKNVSQFQLSDYSLSISKTVTIICKWKTNICTPQPNIIWIDYSILNYSVWLFIRKINFNFKILYSTRVYKGKTKTCVLHSNIVRLLSRYMHTACIKAIKKRIDWTTFMLSMLMYDQRKQTSYTDAQSLSHWKIVWIMVQASFDARRTYKHSGQSNGVKYTIYKPTRMLHEIAGECLLAKWSR